MLEVFLDTLEFSNILIDSILDKRGSDILLLDMQEQILFADYFLLCNGESSRQLNALASGLRQEAKEKADEIAQRVEGDPEDGWLCVDFGPVVVHIFDPKSREYYNLEELWQDARTVVKIA